MEKRWADIWLYTESSLYSSRLEKYLAVFGEKNVKVILFENLKRNPQYVLGDIFQFLNINDSFVCDTSGLFSRSGVPRSKRVAKVISSSNPLYPLVRAALPSFIGIPFRRFLAQMNRGSKPTLNQADRDRLQAFFAQDIYRLESLLGKRLNWIE